MVALLTDDTDTHILIDIRDGAQLTDELDPVPPPVVLVFPLMLLMRLRIHAAWLLFMLIPS
jgi:hypothetical protein